MQPDAGENNLLSEGNNNNINALFSVEWWSTLCSSNSSTLVVHGAGLLTHTRTMSLPRPPPPPPSRTPSETGLDRGSTYKITWCHVTRNDAQFVKATWPLSLRPRSNFDLQANSLLVAGRCRLRINPFTVPDVYGRNCRRGKLRQWNNGMHELAGGELWTCFEMRPHFPSVVPRTAAGTGRWTPCSGIALLLLLLLLLLVVVVSRCLVPILIFKGFFQRPLLSLAFTVSVFKLIKNQSKIL